ncbi:MAG: YjbQ family protein [Elusimicrobia bacterium]|nr:YjbQ family protein [Elusimicrobiota bacterium]
MTSEIDIETKNEQEMLDITSLVEKELKENDAKNGICFLYCPHTTCGIAINEGADENVRKDVINKLNKLIAPDDKYLHTEGNSHSHIKSILTGNSIFVFVRDFKLELGRWQTLYLCEFDGPRSRKLWLKFISDNN